MRDIEATVRLAGFLRRRDLLGLGFTDGAIRAGLARQRIFRVRHGWFSVPDAPDAAVRAVRVGGRLTSVTALESYGLPVPRRPVVHIAVRATASRLRRMDDRRRRLGTDNGVHIHWNDRPRPGGSIWRQSIDDALLAVLVEESRDIAVACASAVMHHERWSDQRMDAVFRRAPASARVWRGLVTRLDESHGETFFRLWAADAGIPVSQQVHVPGVGRFDFGVGPHTFVEIDGGQHDPEWTDTASSSWEKDHDWDAVMAARGDRVLRFTYRQLYLRFPQVLSAVRRAVADDLVLTRARAKRPYSPRTTVRGIHRAMSVSASRSHAQRKRRRFATKP